MIKKRSVKIAGHKTSVSLEEPFWDELKIVAESQGISLTALIEEIDRRRAENAGETNENLSSALRLHVLERLRVRARR